MWYCDYEADGIKVYTDTKVYGHYNFIRDPHCEICSYPDVETNECTWHSEYYGFDKLYSLGAYYSASSEKGYSDLLVKHILGLKNYKNYAYPLGIALSLCFKNRWTELLDFDIIVPVPEVSDEYKVDKGSGEQYNQAVELALVIHRETGLSLMSPIYKTRPQSFRGLNLKERRAAIRGLYRIKSSVELKDKSIILVDDVATTLSTCCGCAQVLKNAGASVVNVVVAGRNVLVD